MKILFLSPTVPYPPVDGDRQRSYHLLRSLARRHEVHLLCFTRSRTDRAALPELRAWLAGADGVRISPPRVFWNCLCGWFGPQPLNTAAFRSDAMERRVRTLLAKQAFDVVHVYRLRMAPYAAGAKTLKVLDYTDALVRYYQARLVGREPWWKRFYLSRELAKVRRAEIDAAAQFDACLISSDLDRDTLTGLGASGNIRVVTNGADITSLSPQAALTEKPEILFVGNLRYPPNAAGAAWFCREVWPLVRQQVPEARLRLVGRPPRAVWNFPGVELTGLVPDVAPFYRRARVVVCPLAAAAGRQFKVIEAFAAGVPVVATTLVADNLGAAPGEHLLAADRADDFARGVVDLCRDTALAERLRRTGRSLAERTYSWDRAEQDLLAAYDSLPVGPGKRSLL